MCCLKKKPTLTGQLHLQLFHARGSTELQGGEHVVGLRRHHGNGGGRRRQGGVEAGGGGVAGEKPVVAVVTVRWVHDVIVLEVVVEEFRVEVDRLLVGVFRLKVYIKYISCMSVNFLFLCSNSKI